MSIKSLLKKLFQLPIIGGVIAYTVLLPTYFISMVTGPVIFFLNRLRPIKFGKSTIWVPVDKKPVVIESLGLIQQSDPQMFLRITNGRSLMIYYIGSTKTNVSNTYGRLFAIGDSYFNMGAQGVAMFLIQSRLLSESKPYLNQLKGKHDRYLLRSVLDWMNQHSFRPGVINSYRKVVEKWEEKK